MLSASRELFQPSNKEKKTHMWPQWCAFCISVTRLHLLSSDNKSSADEGPLLIRAETLETLKVRGWKVQKSWAFHLQWEPCVKLGAPAVVLNLCPSEEIEKWPSRPYLTLSLHLPFPFKHDHMVQRQKGILIGLRWIIYNYDWINL